MNLSAPATLSEQGIAEAAAILWSAWRDLGRIDQLPLPCRPANRADGYAIQAAVARLAGQGAKGWKIAATSLAGQKHIGVDGPLAGRLLANRCLEPGASVSLEGNLMRVAEAEFAFRIGRDLPRRDDPYEVAEVMAAVAALHPAIEVPDSRFAKFAQVGAPQLIADHACASWFLLGSEAPEEWRKADLVRHPVAAWHDEVLAGQGTGASVLGDPRIALTWIANELRVFAKGLSSGDIVTTGTCVVPVSISPGERVRVDFGRLGGLEAAFC